MAHLSLPRLAGACAAALLLAGVTALPVAAAPAVPDTMAQRVRACTGCHGREGRASPEGYVPRIAGKPAAYLRRQLLAFRDGRRVHDGMARLLENLTDAYLGEIAAHFAGQDLPHAAPAPRPPMPPAVQARAQRLVRHGDAARQLPACAACHGDTLTGVTPSVPGLLGLPRDYVVAQLGAWRVGKRRTAEPDCMARIAGRLDGDEIAALADWLHAQPWPARPAPSSTVPPRWPMDCASLGP